MLKRHPLRPGAFPTRSGSDLIYPKHRHMPRFGETAPWPDVALPSLVAPAGWGGTQSGAMECGICTGIVRLHGNSASPLRLSRLWQDDAGPEARAPASSDSLQPDEWMTRPFGEDPPAALFQDKLAEAPQSQGARRPGPRGKPAAGIKVGKTALYAALGDDAESAFDRLT